MSKYIILGATGGIGRSLSKQLATDDTQVFLLARDSDALTQLSSELAQPAYHTDCSNFDQVEKVFQEINQENDITAIINCCGSVLLKPAHSVSE